MTNNSCSPHTITSHRKIIYRQSGWRVHQFKILSGEVVCTVAVLRMEGSLLLWLGSGSREAELNEIALGMPAHANGAAGRAGLATTLLGVEGAATAMARRLTALLKRPVYVCAGSEFDRFTMPIVERGLIAEIKNKPECF